MLGLESIGQDSPALQEALVQHTDTETLTWRYWDLLDAGAAARNLGTATNGCCGRQRVRGRAPSNMAESPAACLASLLAATWSGRRADVVARAVQRCEGCLPQAREAAWSLQLGAIAALIRYA